MTIRNILLSLIFIFSLAAIYLYVAFFRADVKHVGSFKKIKAPLILFDFDGVLCDSYQNVIKVINENATKYNYARLTENTEVYRGMSTSEMFSEAKINKLKLPFLVKVWRKSLAPNISNMDTFKGIPELIGFLKKNNFSIGIVTSNSIKNVKAFLGKHDIDKFDFIYSGTGVFSKDKIFRKIINKFHIKSEDIFYIGDETRDIKASKKANINIISVTWGFQSESILKLDHPDYLAQSPSSLIGILDKLHIAKPLSTMKYVTR